MNKREDICAPVPFLPTVQRKGVILLDIFSSKLADILNIQHNQKPDPKGKLPVIKKVLKKGEEKNT